MTFFSSWNETTFAVIVKWICKLSSSYITSRRNEQSIAQFQINFDSVKVEIRFRFNFGRLSMNDFDFGWFGWIHHFQQNGNDCLLAHGLQEESLVWFTWCVCEWFIHFSGLIDQSSEQSVRVNRKCAPTTKRWTLNVQVHAKCTHFCCSVCDFDFARSQKYILYLNCNNFECGIKMISTYVYTQNTCVRISIRHFRMRLWLPLKWKFPTRT